MLTPGLRGLRERYAQARIVLSVQRSARPIYRHNPHVDSFVGRYRRGKELAAFASRYDLFLNLKHCIEGNPLAEVENAYDLICERLGVTPSRRVPEVYLTEDEERFAHRFLQRIGLLPAPRGLILMHGKASRVYRSLNPVTLWQTARYFAGEGFKVGLLGLDDQREPRMTEPDIVPLGGYARTYGIRLMLALFKSARLFIGTDSVFSHGAAAFGTPSVLLYGPFDAYLRAKYFRHATCLQAQVPCGPCQSHFFRIGYCPLYPQSIPECMDYFRPEMIIEAAEQRLAADASLPQRVPLNRVPDPVAPSSCPYCDSAEMRLYKRISGRWYYECRACLSLCSRGAYSKTASKVLGLPGGASGNMSMRADVATWSEKLVRHCLHTGPGSRETPRMDCPGTTPDMISIDTAPTDDQKARLLSHAAGVGRQTAARPVFNSDDDTPILVIRNINQDSEAPSLLMQALESEPSAGVAIVLLNLRNIRRKRDVTLLFPRVDIMTTLPTPQGFENLVQRWGWQVERYCRIQVWPTHAAAVLKRS